MEVNQSKRKSAKRVVENIELLNKGKKRINKDTMGLSIYYSGRIKNAESLPLLVEEVKDISEIYGWKYKTYETYFPRNALDKKESFQMLGHVNNLKNRK